MITLILFNEKTGDAAHKPSVSAEPDIVELDLDGEEDFFVLGCDGLFDNLNEGEIAQLVYTEIKKDPG